MIEDLCNRIIDFCDNRWINHTGQVRDFWTQHDFCFLKEGDAPYQECYDAVRELVPDIADHAIDIRASRYKVGDYIGKHQDTGNPSRFLSIVFQLSNPSEYEGGELVFDDGRKAPTERGSYVIFKPTEYHEVLKVTRGTRYTLVCWIKRRVQE